MLSVQYGAFEDSHHIVLVEEYASMVRMCHPLKHLQTVKGCIHLLAFILQGLIQDSSYACVWGSNLSNR